MLFCIFLFGLVFAYRTFFQQIDLTKKQKQVFAKIVTFVFMPLLFLPYRVIVTLITLKILFFALYFLTKVLQNYIFQRGFEKKTILLLNQMILFMQTGHSFRSAFQKSIVSFSKKEKEKLYEIYEIVTFSQQLYGFQGSVFEKNFLIEMIAIDKSTNRSIERLINFRRELQLTALFRHKSREVTITSRVQSLILTLLYLFLLVFVVVNFGFDKNKVFILSSALLFSLGLVLFYVLGRKKRWRV